MTDGHCVFPDRWAHSSGGAPAPHLSVDAVHEGNTSSSLKELKALCPSEASPGMPQAQLRRRLGLLELQVFRELLLGESRDDRRLSNACLRWAGSKQGFDVILQANSLVQVLKQYGIREPCEQVQQLSDIAPIVSIPLPFRHLHVVRALLVV